MTPACRSLTPPPRASRTRAEGIDPGANSWRVMIRASSRTAASRGRFPGDDVDVQVGRPPGRPHLHGHVRRERLAGATHLASVVMDRLGDDNEELAAEIRDLIWTMNSPLTFTLLVTERGWPLDRYEAWVRRTLVAATTEGKSK